MQVETFPLGPLETNSYLAWKDGKAVAVDVGGNPSPMLRFVQAHGLTITHILLTHLHFDHTFGVQALCEATGAPVLAAELDTDIFESELAQGGFMGFPKVKAYTFTPLAEGAHQFMDLPCRVFATPGHMPGSLSFYFPDAGVVFVGDLIFYRSVGRTDFPKGDHATLVESVRTKIFTLPGATVIYPGHGPETTVEAEKLHNPYFSDFAR